MTYDWTCCRMASMCDDYGRSRFTYDVANRLVSAVDGTGHVVLNRYDGAGRRSALTLPDGSGYAYDYDVYGQIDRIDGTSGVTSWDRNADRRLRYFTPPTFSTERIVTYGWTPTALAIAEEIASGGFSEAFTLTDPQMPGASPLNVTDATLSLADELTVRRDLRVIRDVHTGGTPEMDLTYTYDPAGNRTGREDLLATPVNLDYEYFNAANQLVGQKPVQGTTPLEIIGNMIEIAHEPNNITVDKNGNITKIDYYQMVYVDADPGVPVDPEWQRLHTFTWNFRFDYENRLIEARGTQIAIPNALDPENDEPAPIEAAYFNYEFGYDGLGRRVWTQENSGNGSWFIYDGDQLVQERDFRSDALIVEYAWGPTTGAPAIFYQKRIVADVPKEHWIYTSPQGGFPRHLFDDTGAITDTFQYSSFGELVFHEGTTEVDFGWKGGWCLNSGFATSSILLASGLRDNRNAIFQGANIPALGALINSASTVSLGVLAQDIGGGIVDRFRPTPLPAYRPIPLGEDALYTCCQRFGYEPPLVPGGAVCAKDSAGSITPKYIPEFLVPTRPLIPAENCYRCLFEQVLEAKNRIEHPTQAAASNQECTQIRECMKRMIMNLWHRIGSIDDGRHWTPTYSPPIADEVGIIQGQLKVRCSGAQSTDFGCTQCEGAQGTIFINCQNPQNPNVTKNKTLYHELAHYCLSCENRRLHDQSIGQALWDVATDCQWSKCVQAGCLKSEIELGGTVEDTHSASCKEKGLCQDTLSITCGGFLCKS